MLSFPAFLRDGKPPHVAGALLLPILVSACGQQTADGGAASNACTGGDNLLQDTRFETLDAPRVQRQWLSSQHSTDISFSYTATDGVLTITQTGDEPWFLLAQSVDGTDWAGKRVRFSAELKLALELPETEHSFRKGGGLLLRARKGGRVVLSSEFEHQPNMGQHDWQQISITRDVPPGADNFQVGFQHQAGGHLQARNPELRIIPEGCS